MFVVTGRVDLKLPQYARYRRTGNDSTIGCEHRNMTLLNSVSDSMATTIVSGGHLTTALKQQGLTNKINHISTAGGALVLYLTGEKLPMIKALEDAAIKYRSR